MRPSRVAGIAGVAFAITLPVYLATMNRSVGSMDRGELAAAAATWGIPHATGYPTLMLVAGTLVHLIPLRPVLVLNVLATLFVSLGVGITAVLFDYLLNTLTPTLTASPRAALAIIASLFLAFTTTWWQQANGFEVYALHCFFLPLLLLLYLRWLYGLAPYTHSPPSDAPGRAFAFGLVTGLSLTNHLTTILLAPGLIIVAALRLGPQRILRALPSLVSGCLLGLLPYIWLPIRASMHPTIDWGDPHSLQAFLHHVTGADYRGRMFIGVTIFTQQLRFTLWHLAADFAWIGAILVGLGAVFLVRKSWHLGLLMGLIILAGITFAANYRIPDIDSYLLTATFGLTVIFLAGLSHLFDRFGIRASLICGLTLALTNCALNWRQCDESEPSLAEAFFRDLVGPLPPRSVLFTAIWGQAVSPAYYFQTVEAVRPDVTIICLDLTRVSWYLDALERRDPELVHNATPQLIRYRAMLRRAEQGAPYNGKVIETARRDFLTTLAERSMRYRPVFTTGALPEQHTAQAHVPFHLAMWLRADTTYVPESPWRYEFRRWRGRIDMDVAMTCQAYAEARVVRALYESAHGRSSAVADLLESAEAFDPHIHPQDIAPMPLNNEQVVLGVAAYFRRLATALPRSSP